MSHYAPAHEDFKQQQYQQPYSNNHLKETLELHVACRAIIKADLLSKSDPFIVVSLRGDNGNFFELGRTETINNVTNAEFAKSFPIDYYFEKEQRLKFDVYDCDKPNSSNLSDHDFLGTCNCTLGEIVHSTGAIMSLRLMSLNGRPMKSGKEHSTLLVNAQKIEDINDKFNIIFKCNSLPKMDTFGSIDAYVRICKVGDSEREEYNLNNFKTRAMITAYKSEIIKSNYNPVFNEFILECKKLFGMNESSKRFEVQIYDWDKNSDDDFVGSVLITNQDLKECHKGGMEKVFYVDLYGDLRKKYAKKKDKDKPKLILTKCKQQASMIDFLQGGCDFSLLTAVDYTGSNLVHAYGGSPATDLHHIFYNTDKPSQYQMAIRKIGNILQTYDSDQLYPLWGFGLWGPFTDAPQATNTRHGFNVNTEMLGFREDEVGGIYGLENCYLASLGLLRAETFKLSGPTYFSAILSNARDEVEESFKKYQQGTGRLTYFIFLIITDGAVSTEDMLKTINVIVDIAQKNLPMSIIIVGVGNGPFDTMNLLDGDFLSDIKKIELDTKLNNKKKESAIFNLLNETGYKFEYVEALKQIGDRDIVDFIELKDFDSRTLINSKGETLESCTLKEIPTHFLKFIEKNRIPIPDNSEHKEIDFNNVGIGVGGRPRGASNGVGGALGSIEPQETYYPDLSNIPQYSSNYGQSNGNNNNNNYWDDCPLPPGWERGFMPDGRIYYVSHSLQQTQWMHPDDPTSPQKTQTQ